MYIYYLESDSLELTFRFPDFPFLLPIQPVCTSIPFPITMANLFRLNLSGRKKENYRIGKNRWKTILVAIFNFAVGWPTHLSILFMCRVSVFNPREKIFFSLTPTALYTPSERKNSTLKLALNERKTAARKKIDKNVSREARAKKWKQRRCALKHNLNI